MLKSAVLGDYDSIYGFAALGLDIFPVKEEAEAAAALKKLSDGKYAVVYVTEYVAELLKTQIAQHNENIIPAIIPIPGVSGNTGIGMNNVKKYVEQAVGSDIIFNGENE